MSRAGRGSRSELCWAQDRLGIRRLKQAQSRTEWPLDEPSRWELAVRLPASAPMGDVGSHYPSVSAPAECRCSPIPTSSSGGSSRRLLTFLRFLGIRCVIGVVGSVLSCWRYPTRPNVCHSTPSSGGASRRLLTSLPIRTFGALLGQSARLCRAAVALHARHRSGSGCDM